MGGGGEWMIEMMIMGAGLLCFGKGRVEAEIPLKVVLLQVRGGTCSLFLSCVCIARRDGYLLSGAVVARLPLLKKLFYDRCVYYTLFCNQKSYLRKRGLRKEK